MQVSEQFSGGGGGEHTVRLLMQSVSKSLDRGVDPGVAQADQIENAGETDGCDLD